MNFYNNKQQNIGELGQDKIFRKVVSGKRHKMKIYEAWGFEQSMVEKLKQLGCKEIRVKDIDNGAIFSTTLDTLEEKGIKADFDTPQVFLPLKHFV